MQAIVRRPVACLKMEERLADLRLALRGREKADIGRHAPSHRTGLSRAWEFLQQKGAPEKFGEGRGGGQVESV